MIVLSNQVSNYKPYAIILFSMGGFLLLLQLISLNPSFLFAIISALVLWATGFMLLKTSPSAAIIKYDTHNGILYVGNQNGSINIPKENILNLKLKYETNYNYYWENYACYTIVTRVNGSIVNYTLNVHDNNRDQQENYRKFKAVVTFLRHERIQNLKRK